MRGRLLLVALMLVLPVAGCGLFGSDPRGAAGAFLAAVAAGDAPAAGRLTDNPAAATALVTEVRKELAPQRVQLDLGDVRTEGDTTTASFTAFWDLGKDRQWRYDGRFDLVEADNEQGWAVRWTPSVLHPKLAAQQRVELRAVPAEPAPVVDRTGTPLLGVQPVVTVALDRTKAPDLPGVAARLAGALSRFDPAITQQSIVDGANAAPAGQPSVVASLREQDYQAVRGQIYDLPGVTFPSRQRLLGPDRDFASQLVPGLRTVVEEQLDGAAGWQIVTVDAVGGRVAELAGRKPHPVPTLDTTVDRAAQAAAEDAVNAVPNPTMIVAIQPSSGGILAVAQNAAADAQGPLALMGRYPPGSTFKIVTAAAALQSGALNRDTPVACPGTTTIGGRVVPNIDRFDLGTVPLHTAFARSCNTTFARLAADFAPEQLTDTAHRMGVGMDYTIPGVTTLTGAVPPGTSPVQRAEDGFGQGQVLTTPFGMALVAATVARGGEVPTPSLIKGMDTRTATPPGPPVPGEVTGPLGAMMREVVTDGTATALRGAGELHGKTGTAEIAGAESHGWFVGYRDDVAFATLVVGGGASGPAVQVSGRFLDAVAPR